MAGISREQAQRIPTQMTLFSRSRELSTQWRPSNGVRGQSIYLFSAHGISATSFIYSLLEGTEVTCSQQDFPTYLVFPSLFAVAKAFPCRDSVSREINSFPQLSSQSKASWPRFPNDGIPVTGPILASSRTAPDPNDVIWCEVQDGFVGVEATHRPCRGSPFARHRSSSSVLWRKGWTWTAAGVGISGVRPLRTARKPAEAGPRPRIPI